MYTGSYSLQGVYINQKHSLKRKQKNRKKEEMLENTTDCVIPLYQNYDTMDEHLF